MKILIIDNEAPLRTILKDMVLLCGNYIIDEAESVMTAIERVKQFNPDILLLDVEMEDGTGFDLLNKLHHINFQLIFTTAYNQYAVQAFKCSAIDYLLKPIDPFELKTALQKAEENIANHLLKQQVEVLLQQVNNTTNTNKQIVLSDTQRKYFINVNDVLYCNADGAYTVICFINQTKIYQSHNLKYFEEMLEQYGFVRTHHSWLVNKIHIKQFDKKADALVLINNEQVPVAQRKKDIIAESLKRK